MIVKDGKCHASGPKPVLKITSVENLGSYQLKVRFNDNVVRRFDGRQLLGEGPVFQPLTDESVFDNFQLDYETLTWRNGEIDIAPEYVYEMSEVWR